MKHFNKSGDMPLRFDQLFLGGRKGGWIDGEGQERLCFDYI